MTAEADIRDLLERTGARMVRLVGGPRAGDTLGIVGEVLRVPQAQTLAVLGRRMSTPAEFNVRHGTYRQKPANPDLLSWRGWDDLPISDQCTFYADRVVPDYRGGKRAHSCGSQMAHRWQAAWDGACLALGGDPADYRR